MTEPPKPAPMVLSLFTGAGGLDLDLETAGCIIIGSVESDPAARDSLLKNRPGWPHLASHDVHLAAKLLPRDLGLKAGELDILAGAPPCQPFSTAAQWAASGRKGMKDVRADTIGEEQRMFAGVASEGVAGNTLQIELQFLVAISDSAKEFAPSRTSSSR